MGWQEADAVELVGFVEVPEVPGGDPSGSGGAEGRGDVRRDPDTGEESGDAEGVPHAWAETSVSVSEFGVSTESVSDSAGAVGAGDRASSLSLSSDS